MHRIQNGQPDRVPTGLGLNFALARIPTMRNCTSEQNKITKFNTEAPPNDTNWAAAKQIPDLEQPYYHSRLLLYSLLAAINQHGRLFKVQRIIIDCEWAPSIGVKLVGALCALLYVLCPYFLIVFFECAFASGPM